MIHQKIDFYTQASFENICIKNMVKYFPKI